MMIKHALKLIWTQRKKNGWILLELFLVFLLLWYIVDFFVVLTGNSLTPTGTEIDHTYLITYNIKKADNPSHIAYEEESEEPGKNFLRFTDRIRQYPGIEAVSIGHWHYPYCLSSNFNSFKHDSLSIQCQLLQITPDYFKVFKVRPKNGGDPKALEQAITSTKDIILTSDTEKKLFPKGSSLGQYIKSGDMQYRIKGITVPIKLDNYTRSQPFAYQFFDEKEILEEKESNIWNGTSICIRTKPGLSEKIFPEQFKKEMKETLSIGNFFLTDVIPMSKIRMTYLKSRGVIVSLQYNIGLACFFLTNIFLGVLGTFWLRVDKRRPEIGLRMAVGSPRKSILALMQTEGLCLLVFATIPALIVCINLVAMDLMPTNDMDFTFLRFLWDSLLTFLLLTIVILLSIWYPARRSANTEPAEALHYE